MKYAKLMCLILSGILIFSLVSCERNDVYVPAITVEPTAEPSAVIPTPALPEPTLEPNPASTPESTPNLLATLLKEAKELYLASRFDEAITKCNEAISLSDQTVEPFLLLADILHAMGDRDVALEMLKQEILLRGGSCAKKNELLVVKYWNMYCDVIEENTKPLKDNELSKLGSLAYIGSSYSVYPFMFIEELDVEGRLSPLGIIFGSPMIYDSLRKDMQKYRNMAYKEYKDFLYTDSSGRTYPTWATAVKAEVVERIVLELFDCNIPVPVDGMHDSGFLNYANGMYYFEQGDYYASEKSVNEYYYLGNDTYIVAFDGIDSEACEVVSNIAYYIVKRATTPLGFMVISKLKDVFDEDLFDAITMPEGFVSVK